jgi:tRNA threonylcarbamoyladenosine biosynthesis protein TsaB
MLLAIDTATRLASLALYDESGIVAEQSWRSANNHSVETMPAIAEMLARPTTGAEARPTTGAKARPTAGMEARPTAGAEALKAVAVAKGPGSFTGLRISISIAKGLCLGLGIPLIAIPSLDITAYAVGDPGRPVYAVLEAGRGRICVARYHFAEGLPVQEGATELWETDAWNPPADEPVLVAGEVSAELAERLLQGPQAESIALASLAESVRRAGYLAELAWERLLAGRIDDLDTTQPDYIQFTA